MLKESTQTAVQGKIYSPIYQPDEMEKCSNTFFNFADNNDTTERRHTIGIIEKNRALKTASSCNHTHARIQAVTGVQLDAT